MNDYVNAGVALVVAVILGIVGTQVAVEADYDTVYTIDTTGEWDNGTLNALNATNNELVLASANTTGDYTSASISNETNRVTVYTSLSDPDNSSLNLTVGGDTYELQDGRNTFELGSSVQNYQFTLDYSRDSTSVTSPAAQTYTARFGSSGLITLIASAAFALLLLFAVLQLRNNMPRNGVQP